MNPFRPNLAEPFTESDLIAFHLHDLPPHREQALRRALEVDPALAAESASVAASLQSLKDVPMKIDETVLDRNWKALRPSLAAHTPPPVHPSRWRMPVFAGALVASAATLAFFIAPRHPAPLAPRQAVNPSAEATPGPLPASTHDQASGSSTNPSPEPLFKADLHTGLFSHPADQPEPPIKPLTLAQVRTPPPPAPPLTPTPEPLPTVAASSSTPDSAQPSSQEQPSARSPKKEKAPTTAKAHRKHETDVMLALGGNFVVPQGSITATHAIAAVGALHQQFRPALGYRITASYSRPDFAGINSRIYEIAGTYVVRGPRHNRFSTSADAGAGLLAFLPTSSAFSTTKVYRVAGLAGVNVDYAITSHWGARLAYRAQIFKTPDFRYTGTVTPVSTTVTVSNEPSLGITYTFGKK